ncbi:hypothetical protein AGDE_01529 [Angomonas deanei]|uniref:NifU-like domain containing protein, putative n=1 Tax=Angomonas deanei TaxID=59799 RepID=A0A7G2CEP8_9TRYP|nr:hypothetical protein AGDE_01529 [Angomonas deanei]CAD2217815.1 NifU-like domain containing protein, putative [Angomonas deanei]|eukprot:EPY42394.1 hypothetical protein AGDE_01529 [Angomonas deanei]
MIKELIHTTIRPQLQDDGGDIRFCRFVADGGVMEVEMLGACRTCKSSKTTLVDLIERTTRHWIPEVKEVKQVERASAFEQFSADHEAAEEEEVDDEEDNSNRVEIEEKGQAADSGARVVRKVNESTESSVQ